MLWTWSGWCSRKWCNVQLITCAWIKRDKLMETRNVYKIWIDSPEGQRSFGRCKHMWEDHIEIHVRGKHVEISLLWTWHWALASETTDDYRQKTPCQGLRWLPSHVHSWPSVCVAESAKSRSIATDSIGGEVPNKYYVVLNNDLVKVRYLLVYNSNLPQAR
jgi:hypothetical protein